MGSSLGGDVIPLLKGSSREVIGENIRELRNTGRPEDQAIAIAMNTAGKARPKKGKKPHIGKPATAAHLGPMKKL